mmetsp:Transcript_16932/g.12109  ORF Transcript_16932/g.12109 Transcript_16932/m.12109 type:complete len:511 (-) Transcript_16932:79-1611(-)
MSSSDSHFPKPPSVERQSSSHNPLPQNAPGAAAAVGHTLENSIPLSIFPLQPDKFCIALTGIPGRGKTHISRRLGRYLDFFHALPVLVLHVADYRRKLCGALKDAEWFDPHNEEAHIKREECMMAAVHDMNVFLGHHNSGVVILDSINETHVKRWNLTNAMQAAGAKALWIEVSNDDESFLSSQYRNAVLSPDYMGMADEDAERDYRRRVEIFRAIFEPLDHDYYASIEQRWSYLKCDHSKQHFVVHNVKGHLFQKVVNFIMNMRTTSHAFYLTRHGQSEYNDLGRIGGDSGLTAHGLRYAQKLAEFVERNIVKDKDGNDVPARLWTSTMRRTKETAQFIKQSTIRIRSETDPSLEIEWVQMRPRAWHHLDELFAGSCDGMTYEEIEEKFPDEWERRMVDKLAYRYPRGESYLDVIARLEPIIIEMERHQEPLLIVAHQGILRIIYAFYMGLSRAEAPYVSIPLNTIVQLTPRAYDCLESRHQLYRPERALPHDGQTEASSKNNDDPQSH